MHKSPLDPPVDDQAPEAEVLTGYDHYPCSQHVSCADCRVQRVDLVQLSTERGGETGSDPLDGRYRAALADEGGSPAILFEC